MGKRSNFPRVDKDYYATIDPRAVQPLLPHLGEGVRYAEPCAGNGALIDLLAPHATCVWASDIEPKRADIHENDARTCGIGDADMFISNPPWSRALLHPIIVNLSDQAPSWLLFDAPWAFTRQAKPFMERCRRIVSVGRLKWIAGTTMAGKDDAAFYLFDKPLAGSAPVFYGHGCSPPEAPRRPRRVCYDCGVLIDRFGKWRLEPRNGILTTVHMHCDNPSSRFARGVERLEPMPLFPSHQEPSGIRVFSDADIDFIAGIHLPKEFGQPKFTIEPGADEPEDPNVVPFLRRLRGA